MRIRNAREFFEALASRGQEPRLADVVGRWEFDVADAGTWTVNVDRGALRVAEGVPRATKGAAVPAVRMHLDEAELLRLLRGEGHENIQMALLRGALTVEGELALVARLQTILPLREETLEAGA
jgi:hypothetical protein